MNKNMKKCSLKTTNYRSKMNNNMQLHLTSNTPTKQQQQQQQHNANNNHQQNQQQQQQQMPQHFVNVTSGNYQTNTTTLLPVQVYIFV
jgi:hypothetical protein